MRARRDVAHEATIALIRRLRAAGPVRRRARPARQLQPNAIRLEYFKALRARFLAPARAAVDAELLPELEAILAERGDAARADAGGKRVNTTMDRITKRFWEQTFHPREAEALAEQFADRTKAFQRDQLSKQVRSALGVDVLHAEPNLESVTEDFVAENVALIKTVPSRYFDDVETVVTRGVREGRRHEDIARDLVGTKENPGPYYKADNRAKLVARDQVGKFYGKLNEVRQQALGVDGYIWRTSHDNRVREEHEMREGESFTWDAPPEDGHPGQAINCRCYAEADLSSLLGDDE